MDEIKIIRLQSGEDIIAAYKEDEEEGGVELLNPMCLIFKRLPTGKAVMMMGPWLPAELIETNATWIYTHDILTVMTPRKSLVEYYKQSIVEMQNETFRTAEEIEETLEEMSLEDDDEEDDNLMDEEEALKELEEIRKSIKKRLLH
jgi:hypothetical protein